MTSRVAFNSSATGSHDAATAALRNRATPSNRLVLGLAFVLLAILTIPLLISPIPPLVDYPSHLARIKILQEMFRDGFAENYYELSSVFVPNVLFDALSACFSKIMTIENTGKFFLILTLGLQIFGTIALHRSLHRRTSYWPLSAAFFLYGWALLYGFLNYVAGVGLMLMALALWIRLDKRSIWLRCSVGAVAVTIIYFTHIIVLVVYAAAIAGFELQAAAAVCRRSPRAAATRLAIGAAPFLIPGCLFLTDKLTVGAFPNAPVLLFDSKIAGPLIAATAGNPVGDVFTALALVAFLVIILAATRVRIAPQFRLALAFACIAFLLVPFALLAEDLDVRMPLAIGFLAIAAIDVDVRKPKLAAVAALIMTGVIFVRAGELATQSWRYAGLVDSYRLAFRHIEPGSTLIVARDVSCPPAHDNSCRGVATSPIAELTPFRQALEFLSPDIYDDRLTLPPHLASLAAIDADVFVPEIFSTPGIQPVQVRNGFAELKILQGDDPVDVASTDDLREFTDASEKQAGAVLPGRPLYLLVQRRVGSTGLSPEDAVAVAEGKGFSLFRLPDPSPNPLVAAGGASPNLTTPAGTDTNGATPQ